MSYYTSYMLLLPVILFGFLAQHQVQATFNKYYKVYSKNNLSGREVARIILDRSGLSEIDILPVSGMLTDHYSPYDKKVFLSESVYQSTSISAIAVAAHEVGHAIQDKENYLFFQIRDKLVPAVQISNQFVWLIIMGGILFSLPSLINIGILLFSICVLFQLITLPVELNASKRALNILEDSFLVEEENQYAKKVLFAAAMTYIVATLASITQLARLLLLNRRRNS